MELLSRQHWIFDMDGTLTVAVHDFEAIRHSLGLQSGQPILEQLDAMPETKRRPLLRRLDAIEMGIAGQARPQAGAVELLAHLRSRGAKLGILTRNSVDNARQTLKAAGLDAYFVDECIVGRECATPKPNPDGVVKLLDQWETRGTEAIMVGDFLFDLLAGRQAGTATVYLDIDGTSQWSDYADATVRSLYSLIATR